MMSFGEGGEPGEQLGRTAEAPRTGTLGGVGRRRRVALAPGLVAVVLVAVALVGGAVFGGGVRRGGLRRRLAEGGGDGDDDSDALSGCSVEEVGCFTVRPAPTLASCPEAQPPGSGLRA